MGETSALQRTTHEPLEWADLENVSRADRERLPYHVHQLQPNPDYTGHLTDIPIDEARALLGELVDRFALDHWSGFQLPPTGLPGFVRDGYDENAPEATLIEIGIKYALSIIRSEPRGMHLRWRDAGDFIRKIRDEVRTEIQEQEIQDAVRQFEAREATPQFIYFIGAQSGPIKIGIAVNPQSRLGSLQTGHHEKLTILATCVGGSELEREYHKRFAEHRLSGEWFARCPEIEAEIDRLAQIPSGDTNG